MKLKKIIQVLLPLFMAYATNSYADWQWTKWGINPEQVLSASDGKARLATEAETKSKSIKQDDQIIRVAKAFAPYSLDEMVFGSWFYFNPKTDGLTCVKLVPEKEGSLKALREKLEATYGPETSESHDKLFTGFWINKIVWLKDDEITLEYGGRGTSVEYCQRKEQASQ